jgi:hypothetical protein
MKRLTFVIALPLALAVSIARAGPSTANEEDPDLLPDPEGIEGSPAHSSDAARTGAVTVESCATCDRAVKSHGDASAAPTPGANTDVSSSSSQGSSNDNASDTAERTTPTPLIPARNVTVSDVDPASGREPTGAADPKVTVRTQDGGHFAVLVVAPSGARTEIVLDASGRIVGVRNAEKPDE